MKTIAIAEKFYREYEDFLFSGDTAELKKYCAAALVGQGSECFGFDDEISKDHDLEAGFLLLLPKELYEEKGFLLQKKYNELPKTYEGLTRCEVSNCGSGRHGVFSIEDFFLKTVGFPSVPNNLNEWRQIPEYALATAVNGCVFEDYYGKFSEIRDTLKHGYPEDIRLKKLCARLAYAAQSGQYNFPRSLKRQDYGGAVLALHEFVNAAVSAIYLLNNAYMPYYKWAFRGMDELKVLGDMKEPLIFLLTEETTKNTAQLKTEIAEDIAAKIVEALKEQHLTTGDWDYLEPHAFSVREKITNREIKNLHIMAE